MSKKEQHFQIGPDQNRIQAALTKAGRDRLDVGRDRVSGRSPTDEGLSAVDVRRAGLARFALRGTALVASTAVLAAGAIEGSKYLDHQSRSANRVTDTQAHEAYQQIQANEHDAQPIENQPTPAEAQAGAEQTQQQNPQS